MGVIVVGQTDGRVVSDGTLTRRHPPSSECLSGGKEESIRWLFLSALRRALVFQPTRGVEIRDQQGLDERKEQERKGKERTGKERKEENRRGKERTGEERKGKRHGDKGNTMEVGTEDRMHGGKWEEREGDTCKRRKAGKASWRKDGMRKALRKGRKGYEMLCWRGASVNKTSCLEKSIFENSVCLTAICTAAHIALA